MSNQPKPPVGLMPRKFWLGRRLDDVQAAIDRYRNAGFPVSPEWIEERDELAMELAKHE